MIYLRHTIYLRHYDGFCNLYPHYSAAFLITSQDFPRYNMKCSRENMILCGIFHAVSRFPLHYMLYRGNLDYFLDSGPRGNPCMLVQTCCCCNYCGNTPSAGLPYEYIDILYLCGIPQSSRHHTYILPSPVFKSKQSW